MQKVALLLWIDFQSMDEFFCNIICSKNLEHLTIVCFMNPSWINWKEKLIFASFCPKKGFCVSLGVEKGPTGERGPVLTINSYGIIPPIALIEFE